MVIFIVRGQASYRAQGCRTVYGNTLKMPCQFKMQGYREAPSSDQCLPDWDANVLYTKLHIIVRSRKRNVHMYLYDIHYIHYNYQFLWDLTARPYPYINSYPNNPGVRFSRYWIRIVQVCILHGGTIYYTARRRPDYMDCVNAYPLFGDHL